MHRRCASAKTSTCLPGTISRASCSNRRAACVFGTSMAASTSILFRVNQLLLGHNPPELVQALTGRLRSSGRYKYYTSDTTIEFSELLAKAARRARRAQFHDHRIRGNETRHAAARGATGRFDLVSVIRGCTAEHLRREPHEPRRAAQARAGPMLMPARANAVLAPTVTAARSISSSVCNIACLDTSDEMIERTTTGEVAEFLRDHHGLGGMIVPPEGWLRS